MAYPSTAELVAGSTVKELTDLEPAQQEALRDEAIAAVEGVCRQSFTAEGTAEAPVTRTLDGMGSRLLYLPRRLSELTGLSVVGGALTVGDVALSEHHDRLHIVSEAESPTWATQALAELEGLTEAVFPAGAGTVSVSGVWGWADAEFPEQITTALRYDMEDRALANAHALAESVRSARALGVSDIQQGGLSASLERGEPQVSARVARLLRRAVDPPLIWSQATGALA